MTESNDPGSRARCGVFERIGRFSTQHRRVVIGAWALLTLLALPLAPRVADVLRPGGFSLDTLPSERTVQLLEQQINLPPSALVIVIQGQNGLKAGSLAFETAAALAIQDVPKAQYVAGVLSHRLAPRQVSADGSTTYDIVALNLPPDDSPNAVVPVQAALHQEPGITVGIAGGPAFYGDVQAVSEGDLRRAEVISLPLAALALLLVFGSVVAAGVPVVVGGVSVVVALAGIFIAASLTPMSIFVLNLATLLGFGLGVDYALLMSSRFREELGLRRARAALDPSNAPPTERELVDEAIAATVATAGRAVFFSGFTVLLGLVGLMLFEFMVLRSVGIAGAIVLALAVSAALTLLPAILSILGTRLDALPVRRFVPARLRRAGFASPPGAGTADSHGFWWRLANRVMDHPVAVLVPTLGLLLILGTPFLHARFNAPDASILPDSVPSKVTFDALASHFQEGEFAPLLIAVQTNGPATSADNIARLYAYSRELAADPRVSRVQSIVDVDPRLGLTQYQLLLGNPAGPGDRSIAEALKQTTNGNLTAFTVISWYGPNEPQARALVKDLRDPVSKLAPPAGLTVQVGSGAAEVADVVDKMAADFPRTALFIVISTYLVLFVLLRSIVLPAKALVMNALSIVASFGALVWIFQDGNLSLFLGFRPLGFVETTLPVILFCVLFGLSMDYEVFLLTRMKEAWDRTGDNREAVARGLERSGRIVTSAAMIVVLVASSFASAEIVLIKALGIGVAIAVALDATVVRALLVPSTMRLLGHWNWWMPARLERWVTSRLPVISGTLVGAIALALVGVLILGACTPGTALLANPTNPAPAIPSPTAAASRVPDPQPVVLPRDDGAHDRLTEWWYDTGHLQTVDGRHFGFELVIFRAERGLLPVSWASHFALTDESGNRFLYDQRSQIGPEVNRSTGAPGFDLGIVGDTSPGYPNLTAEAWTMRGAGGRDHQHANGTANGVAFGIDLALDAGSRPVAFHDGDGYVDFGPAGGSYYYSRTNLAATGMLTIDGSAVAVSGDAWFDHQWGDFIAVGGGGWDWFAMNLADGTDITLSLVRAADGSYPLVYGTQVNADGSVAHLDRTAFAVSVTDHWTSPHTGAVYPAGWQVTIPGDSLVVNLAPTVHDQELDTRPTTGVVYWEGSQVVSATRSGEPLAGQAYVELTGYGPAH